MRLLLSADAGSMPVMELLIALNVAIILGVLAQTMGADSRDADPTRQIAAI
jgi:hypothetical protein